MTSEFCISARDELRVDPLTGEFYETGIVLCCTAPPALGSLYCRTCQPRSANRGAPYRVVHGYNGMHREQFPTFEAAFDRYAELRSVFGEWGVHLSGAGAEGDSDGLDDYERERLGELP